MPWSDTAPDVRLMFALLTRDRPGAPAGAPAGANTADAHTGDAHTVEAHAAHLPAAASCVSCGRESPGIYCTWCGERRPEARQYTLRGFAAEAFESLSDVDGRLLRSVRTLFNAPGELTARYMRGERARWLPPLRLFLLMNVVFFLLAERFGTRIFDTPLNVQMTMQWFSGWIAPMVEARVAARGLTIAQYAAVFDRVTATQARTLVILMVPAFALVAALVNVRQRRPALHHLAFALHAYAAMLGLLIATYAAIVTVVVAHLLVTGRDLIVRDAGFSLVLLAVVSLFFGASQRGAYGDSRWVALIKGAVLAFSIGLILQGYRLVLFFFTFWST